MKLTKVTQQMCVWAKELSDAKFTNAYISGELKISERTLRSIRRSGYNVKEYHKLLHEAAYNRRKRNEAKRTILVSVHDGIVSGIRTEYEEIIGKMQEERKNDILSLNTAWSEKARNLRAWVSTYRLLFFLSVTLISASITFAYLSR